MTSPSNKTHGLSRTPEYVLWTNMVARCHNPANTAFHRYGGKGVTVCDRWRNSFAEFLADMGLRPPGMTLDRIDNDKGYDPSNCRWADRITQANNKRDNRKLTYLGETLGISQWARRIGINKETLRKRLMTMTVDRALSLPRSKPGRKFHYQRKPPAAPKIVLNNNWCARKTHCPSGHPYSPENTITYRGMRYCRACRAIRRGRVPRVEGL